MPHMGSMLKNDTGNSDSFTCLISTLHPKDRATQFVVVLSGISTEQLAEIQCLP